MWEIKGKERKDVKREVEEKVWRERKGIAKQKKKRTK